MKGIYEKKLFEAIGTVAAHPAPLVPWHTQYCLYDTFDAKDLYDENYECAVAIRDVYRAQCPHLTQRAERIFDEYCRLRRGFEAIYRSLPKAVFQGDINDSNVLLSEKGKFKGLIDFNLSGTETILHYAFCESFAGLENAAEIASLKARDRKAAERLSWIGGAYTFTAAEREAFSDYYHMVAPFRWTYPCFFLPLLQNREKYPYGGRYAETILGGMTYQHTRGDAGSLLP